MTIEFDPNEEGALRKAFKLVIEQMDYFKTEPIQADLFAVDPLKGVHANYRRFLKALTDELGYNHPVNRKFKKIQELRYVHQIDDVTDFLKAMEKRKVIKLTWNKSHTRIHDIEIMNISI